MTFEQILAIAIFAIAMIIIMSEKIHRSTVAIAGAMLVIILGLVQFSNPSEAGEIAGHAERIDAVIDFNTLGVLFGMMLFVSVVKLSGLFEFLAIKSAQIAKGNPWKIMIVFVILTAVLSAFLDNVTTVLLVGPMIITICRLLEINPVSFIITIILASNIGGTATLIGDPPNIMIGSAANISFISFLIIDGPCIIIILTTVIAIFWFLYGKKMKIKKKNIANIMNMDANKAIKNIYLMKLSLILIALIVLFFMVHDQLSLQSSYIAIAGAGLMLLLSRENVEKALDNIEWTTLSFFFGLFVIVGALKQTGVIAILAQSLVDITNQNTFVLMYVLLIGSALFSSFLDNIPFVATILPIITAMQGQIDVAPLWWAISLGVCLGGNGTLIGASANVVLSDIANKNGYPLSFMKFTKTGFPIMLVTIAISAAYLTVRYFTIGF